MTALRKLFSAQARGCAITLAGGPSGTLLVLSGEPVFTEVFSRRWKHASRALVRACDANPGRAFEWQSDVLAVLHFPPEDVAGMALAKRLAAGLFAPISGQRAGAIFGLSAAKLAAQATRPSLALRGKRHQQSYSYLAYSTDDILALADSLRAQANV